MESVFRDLNSGVNPYWASPEDAQPDFADPGIPAEPITTRLEGPWGLPWVEGLEDTRTTPGLTASMNPTYPQEDIGALPIVGAYEGAFRTLGPVMAWGHEPSGGLGGDQAIGRIMRFPANIPERYDPNGVWNTDYRDELAASIANSSEPIIGDAEVTTQLVLYPNVGM